MLVLFSLLAPKNSSAKELLFQDSFDDSNSVGWFETSPWGSWIVESNEYIGQAQLIQSPALPSLSTVGQESWDDYEFNVKLRGILGIDKQILFRVNTSQNRAYILNIRSLYFNGGNDILLAKRAPLGTENASLLTTQQFSSNPNVLYTVKVIVKNINSSVNIVVYIDGSEKINYIDANNPILNGKVGLEVVPGGYLPGNPIGLITKTSYDEIEVYGLDKQISLKQYDPLWKDMTYDSADTWSPGKSTIERYGCALTSAAMILQHYGHDVTPDTLNTWLLANDGYVGSGLLNWSAVTKWAKESHDDHPTARKLEYKRYPFTTDQLDEELTATRPAIVKLKEPDTSSTHFVVVNEKNEEEYKMSDPATTNEYLSFYPSERYNQISSFIPSDTDLSYLYAYIPATHNMSVYSQNGILINTASEAGILEDQIDHEIPTVEDLKTFEYPKPEAGKYVLKITGDGSYQLETRYYDTEANLMKSTKLGNTTNNTVDSYVITIGSEPEVEKVDFDFVQDYIKKEYLAGRIKRRSIYQALLNTLQAAERAADRHNNKVAKILLDAVLLEIKVGSKHIGTDTKTTLTQYIQLLKESL